VTDFRKGGGLTERGTRDSYLSLRGRKGIDRRGMGGKKEKVRTVEGSGEGSRKYLRKRTCANFGASKEGLTDWLASEREGMAGKGVCGKRYGSSI